ncbi:MAG: GMP synthase [Flavobacteriaceae bacterium]|nr:GMP synthase [Flavobacteriaceae bacterium]
MKNLRIAILDMNNGVPNQGMRCIIGLVEQFFTQTEFDGTYDIFDVRQKNEVPLLSKYDIFISSGGPGSPYPTGEEWEFKFNEFLDRIFIHNKRNEKKKFAFLICHSFQLACYHWECGVVSPRRSTSFGIMPVHKFENGMDEILFEGLPNPFFAVDSRDFQVVEPNDKILKEMGAQIVALEKIRPYVELERAVMAIRFSEEIFGTQFHPEADAIGMRFHFSQPERKQNIIQKFGEQKYQMILNHLDDDEKIMLTEKTMIPTFLRKSAEALKPQFINV